MAICDIYMLAQSSEFSIQSGEEKTINIKLDPTPKNLACLYGKVYSRSLQPLQGATVVMISYDWSETYKAVSDCYGSYVFINIPKGCYIQMAVAKGYYASNRECLNVCKCIQPGHDFYLIKELCQTDGCIYGNITGNLKEETTLLLFDSNHESLLCQTTPNSAGQYVFYNIPPRKYSIDLFCGGKKINEQKVAVEPGLYTRVDFS